MINLELESGTPLDKIVLCGHSQGGAVALYSALTYKSKPIKYAPDYLNMWVNFGFILLPFTWYGQKNLIGVWIWILINVIFQTFRKTCNSDHQLGGVAVFGAWLPMSYKFQHIESESIKHMTNVHKILQVNSFHISLR